MNNVAAILALLAAALPAAAQSGIVTIQVKLDQEQYLPNESLVAHVKIQNDSGQTLHLGDAPNWLNLVVESIEGPYVRQIKPPEVLVPNGFDLQSSYTATRDVDLAPCFELNRLGRYKVVATVNVPAFKESFASGPKDFIIANGTVITERTFGVPASISPPGPDGKPEERKYLLVQTNPGGDAKLFVRVTDASERNYRVVQIGPIVSFSKFEPQLDRWSNFHVLYQLGAKSFLYTVINPEGMVLARERYEYTETRPMLVSNAEGRISVRGGERRYSNDDLPPVEPSVILASQLEPEPVAAPTNAPSKKNSAKDAKEKKKP